MRLTDWLLGPKPESIKLQAEVTNSRIAMPKAPQLQYELASLGRYASRSELVYACIEKKAQVACDPELIVQRKTSKGDWEKVEGHRALDSLLNPNPYDDGESFLRTWIASENIAGVFYAEIVRNGAGEPVNLYPLRPDWIFPQYKASAKGDVLDYYAYRVNGYEVRFKPEELLIHRRHGLGSMYSGMSPLAVALASVDADIAATEYVRDFFNNDGTPAGILKITGRNLSDPEAERLKQKWMSMYSRNGKGRGGVAVLDQNADYETVGARLNELDNESLTSIDETRICMAFGVPPVIIGAYVGLKNVNQKASFKGAMEEFWMNTMSPELKAIRKFLTRKYLIHFEDEALIKTDKIRFFWDISHVEALQEDVDAIHDRSALGYKSGIYKLDEARVAVGLDAVGEKLGGEEFYKAPAPMGQQPDEDEPKQLTAGKQLAKEALSLQVMLENKSCTCRVEGCEPAGCLSCTLDAMEASNADLAELLSRISPGDILSAGILEKKTLTYRRELSAAEQSIDIKAIFDSYESGTESLTRVILDIRKDLIDQAVKAMPKQTDANVFTLTLSPPKNAYKLVSKEITRAINEGRTQVFRESVEKEKRWLLNPNYQVKGIIDDLILRLVELTISRVINSIQTAAIDVYAALGVLGLDYTDIENRMREELEERSEKPFENIARQAVNAAVNEGRREEMKAREDEIRLYEYSAILDNVCCDPCAEWDGKQSKDLDDLPETPNEDCLGMGNCRCFIISIFEGEAV